MIISASRRTDIPAFYSDWFMKRVAEGFVMVRNPMNANQVRTVSLEPASMECIVFWTKNPANMLDKLKELDDRGIHYYFQFTLTPYDRTIEQGLPDKSEVVETFIELSERIGREKVIWRYDPILITRDLDLEYHFRSFETLASRLAGHTEKCIISFVDFYSKCRKRLRGLEAEETDKEKVYAVAEVFSRICKSKNLALETCAEEFDLSRFGISHGKCIDDRLISRITGKTVEGVKDRYQRELCGCVAGVDIGEYNTCSHHCLYCYANHASEMIANRILLHETGSPILIGRVE